ncbi:hypothetical protein [Neobacillus sp. OS1-33]|uniref:hypothetical protein n=1 Tax=Neobacillus sp. OS1-33 TaxID=3070683 RepID=UPI0027E16443|nr:hypothetical protein [Neobacillus sp. OS1-33]WML26275.1 hypothetical protein RCG22_01110 [Neobacillus sp. OS1-33]
MYLLHEFSLSYDDNIEEHPICMREKNGEIKHMGILLKRRISQGDYEGTEYYHYVDFYGKSPINFNSLDYKELRKQVNFDDGLKMIADFGFSYSDVSFQPGLGSKKDLRKKDSVTILPVSERNRYDL